MADISQPDLQPGDRILVEAGVVAHGNRLAAYIEHEPTGLTYRLPIDFVRWRPMPDAPVNPGGTVLSVPDGLKMLRETLCLAQNLILHSPQRPLRRESHAARLQELIDECDRRRPLGPDGKHGDRHTDTCGCDDVPVEAGRSTATPDSALLDGLAGVVHQAFAAHDTEMRKVRERNANQAQTIAEHGRRLGEVTAERDHERERANRLSDEKAALTTERDEARNALVTARELLEQAIRDLDAVYAATGVARQMPAAALATAIEEGARVANAINRQLTAARDLLNALPSEQAGCPAGGHDAG